MKRIISLLTTALTAVTGIAADWHYTPLSLTGLNADVVQAPCEVVRDGIDADGRSFYSDRLRARGGLPQCLSGMFSDVPYRLADFTQPCALLLVAGDREGGTLGFETPVKARTLWMLCTAADGPATLEAAVNYADGSRGDRFIGQVRDWSSAACNGTAFWQLGRCKADGSVDGYQCALYELRLDADPSRAVASVDLRLTGGQRVTILAVTSTLKENPASLKAQKDFFISDSHLDTQWNWTVRTTIEQYLKNTLTQNFSRFDDTASSEFAFNFESAIHYRWFKEYYPDLYKRLQDYISQGRWHVSGGAVNANDVNIPSGESLIRNFLYGYTFYKREFGVEGGRDVMLPDCFGFSWALPTAAAHCGKKYFHSQKLSWGSAYAYNSLPRFCRWQGVDGAELLAVLKLCAYDEHEAFRKDMSTATDHQAEIATNQNTYGIPATFKYVGPRSDRGGGLDKETADWFTTSVNGTGRIGVTMGDATTMLDQMFHMGYDGLPVIAHGLPMRAHGVGCYTSRTMLKYWNRKGELLGDAAEKASVAADWLGTFPYQRQLFEDTWTRLLWHQFHDDLTGTSINEAYDYSVNDHVLCQLDFSRTLNTAVGGVAQALQTDAQEGRSFVVYNPLSIHRTDIVEATARFGQNVQSLHVVDADGQEVPSQLLGSSAEGQRFIFLATVPPLGYATYYIQPDVQPTTLDAQTLSVTPTSMENDRYLVTLNDNGDVSSIKDKQNSNRELLRQPIRLALLYDESLSWPSWEIHGDQLQRAPREYVDKEGLEVNIAENGPLRVALKVKRTKAGSTFVQTIRLAAAGASSRIDFVNEIDWQTRERLLKAIFPLTVSNAQATYDLSIGVDVNQNSTNYSTDVAGTDALCEFLGHRWADVTAASGAYGVSILNDCKYGWDKQKDNELRLTLIHTPRVDNSYTYQGNQDIGLNRFTFSVFGHRLKWNADTQWEADRLNQPMLAYETTPHEGVLGHSFAFATVDNGNVAVKALKKAEESDLVILRLYELTGREQQVNITFPAAIIAATEVNGLEQPLAEADFAGTTLSCSIGKFQPKTFAVQLAPPLNDQTLTHTNAPTFLPLNYTYDVISWNDKRSDAGGSLSFPAELLPDTLEADGVRFLIGPKNNGKRNAVRCIRQVVKLPENHGDTRLYVLASSLQEGGTDAIFYVNNQPVSMHIGQWDGKVGQFSVRPTDHKAYRMENTAFTATHSHVTASSSDGIYDYLYMYKYCIDIPAEATSIRLPNNNNVMVYAMSLADNPNDDTRPASQVVQMLRHTDTTDPDVPAGIYPSPNPPSSIFNPPSSTSYDLLGRPAPETARRGLYISKGKKILKK